MDKKGRTSSHSSSSFSRRELLSSVGILMATSPLVLWSQRARAMYNMGSFWKKKAASGLSTTVNLWGSSSLDPYWDYVTLLMQFDGANAATTFSDESNVGKVPTVNGAPYIDTTASTSSPYSSRTGSAKFNSSTPDYLSFTDHQDLDFGTGDFTIELFVKSAASAGTSQALVYKRSSTMVTGEWGLRFDSNDKLEFSYHDGSSSIFKIYSGATRTTNTWHHVTVTRSGGLVRVFLGGTLLDHGAGTTLTVNSSLDNSALLELGRPGYSGSGVELNGQIADLRIYKGVAKYTANFTPRTTPQGLGSTADSNWTYCVLACPFESSLKDMSGKRTTANGSASLTTSTKKYGTASLSLNGTSNYASLGTQSDYVLSSADFTIEFWLYVTSASTTATGILANRTSADGDTSWSIRFHSTANRLEFHTYNSVVLQCATALSANTWNHVSLVRKGNSFTFFINGTLDATSTGSYTFSTSQPLYIGHDPANGSDLTGYIDSLRITKGYARYTSDFTAPTAAFPVGKDETTDPFWNYTVLAMHMDGIVDETGRHTFTNTGSVATNTSVHKYGTASTYYDGATQYLVSSNASDLDFASSDFTVEWWEYRLSGGSSNSVPIARDTSNFPPWLLGYRSGSTVICYMTSNGTSWDMAAGQLMGPLILNQWNHFAISRRGSTFYAFENGILGSSWSNSSSYLSSSSGVALGRRAVSEYFNGYIDDLRITKGVARYVNNFTPPTRAFATTAASAYADYDPFYSNLIFALKGQGSNGGTQGTSDVGGFPLTWNGSMAMSTGQMKLYSSSLYSDSSSKYVSVADNATMEFGSGDWTVSCWVYNTALTGSKQFWRKQDGASSLALTGTISSAGSVGLDVSSADNTGWNVVSIITSTGVIVANTWHYIEFFRSGNTFGILVDGTLKITGSSSLSINDNTQQWQFGKTGSTDGLYTSDWRIYKGISVHTTAFPTPSRILPYVGLGSSGLNLVTSGLVLHLDTAGYNGSQTWKNTVASPADSSAQSAYDFYLGSSSSSEASDPTFIGVSGGNSANDYFSFDGGDYFTLAGSNTSFINGMHKAGATWTIFGVSYNVSSGNHYLFGTQEWSTTYAGLNIWISGGIMGCYMNANHRAVSAATIPSGMCFWACSFTDGQPSFLYANGTQLTLTTPSGGGNTFTYSSANSGASTTMVIASEGIFASAGKNAAGSRLHAIGLYNRALTKTELDQNFNAIRGRFGI